MAMVVASMATQSTPMLSASTARDMAPRNSATRAGYAAAVPGVELDVELRAGRGSRPPQVAVRPTDPTTASMKADSASTRSWPPGGGRCLPVEHRRDQD